MLGLLPSQNYFKCRPRLAAKGYFKSYFVSKARAINISVNSHLSFLALISLQGHRRFPGKLEPAAGDFLGEKKVGGAGSPSDGRGISSRLGYPKLSALRKEAKCLGYKNKNQNSQEPSKIRTS